MSYCVLVTNSEFHVKTELFGRVYNTLNRCGYKPIADDVGNVIGLERYSDNLNYNEEKLLMSIASYVENGSFIEMRGEDGSQWRWIFSNGTLREVKSKLVWEHEYP